MKPFYLKVVASDKTFFDGECTSLVVPVSDGKMGILAGHSDAVILVTVGEMEITSLSDEKIEAFVSSGLLEIIDGEVTIVVISAEKPEDIDVIRAKEAKERAEEELRQIHSIREYYHSTASLSRAMNRLKVKKKYSDKI